MVAQSACCRVVAIADINPELIRASVGVAAVYLRDLVLDMSNETAWRRHTS